MLKRRQFLAASALPLIGATSAEPTFSGTIGHPLTSFAALKPLSLMPGFDAAPPAAMIAGKLLQGLIRLSDTMQPLPELAASWQLEPDGYSCIFTLQSGVMFHDGRGLTLDDVAFSIKYHQTYAPYAGFRWITGIEPLDDHRIRLTANARFEHLLPLLDGLYAPVLSARTGEPDAAEAPIGTGPFQLMGWPQTGETIQLRANPHYWRAGQPRLSGLVYKVEPDPQKRLSAMRNGDAQLATWLDIDSADARSLAGKANNHLQITEKGWGATAPVAQLVLNHKHQALSNQRVRQAINLAIDRDDLVQRVWSGAARNVYGPLPASLSINAPAPPVRDLALAARLLDEAGCQPDDQGVRLHLQVLALPWGDVWDAVLESLRQCLNQIGVALEIVAVSRQDWPDRLADPAIDAALICAENGGSALQTLASAYGSAHHRAKPGANIGGFSDPTVDLLLDQAKNAVSGHAQRRILGDIENRLAERCAQIWLFEPRYRTIMAETLRNVTSFGGGVFSPFDYVFFQS